MWERKLKITHDTPPTTPRQPRAIFSATGRVPQEAASHRDPHAGGDEGGSWDPPHLWGGAGQDGAEGKMDCEPWGHNKCPADTSGRPGPGKTLQRCPSPSLHTHRLVAGCRLPSGGRTLGKALSSVQGSLLGGGPSFKLVAPTHPAGAKLVLNEGAWVAWTTSARVLLVYFVHAFFPSLEILVIFKCCFIYW